MCGIVGLFLKDQSLRPQLGTLLEEMLVTMSDRGPDSAGIAIYGGDGVVSSSAAKLAAKIAKLRIFQDDEGRMNRSVRDVSGGALVVSQFTLAADTSRGNQPGFSGTAAPKHAEHLYERFCVFLADEGVPVESGRFGAEMAVHIDNDGPVTIWLDSEAP